MGKRPLNKRQIVVRPIIGLIGAHLAFNDLCHSVGELCASENKSDIIVQLQGLLKDKQNQPGLSGNVVTVV